VRRALEPTAAAVRVRVQDGEALRMDGPFVETEEVLGGFYLADCDDIDEAVEFAAKIPMTTSGRVEVRRVAQIPGWDEAVDEIRRRLAPTRA
jgi:hypothetical protein